MHEFWARYRSRHGSLLLVSRGVCTAQREPPDVVILAALIGIGQEVTFVVRISVRIVHVNGSCGEGNDRALIAIHRGPKVPSMTVPLDQTWMSGCRIDEPEVAAAGSFVVTSGSNMKLRIQGDDVLLAACRGL